MEFVVLWRTVPRSPQQNGVAKRKNRTILNMMHVKGKKDAWGVLGRSSFLCSLFVQYSLSNIRCQRPNPSRSTEWKKAKCQSLASLWEHIYIYMYIYVHVRQQERSKLDDPSIKHVFIGYDSHSKCYKLYNPHNGKVVVSRDVEFDEKTTWTWETQLRRNNL